MGSRVGKSGGDEVPPSDMDSRERASAASAPRERSGDRRGPASERVGGHGGDEVPPSKNDARFMERALFLAERGRGRTTPNPLVGAVVVSSDGVIVGQGAHLQAGGPHAEIIALQAAGSQARGATLYCTLEPCAHTGRTGPCVERIVAAGVTRVVTAVRDPNPLVAGAGIAYLRAHGIEVVEGLGELEATRLNGPFISWIDEAAALRHAEGGDFRRRVRGPRRRAGEADRAGRRSLFPSSTRRGRRDRGRLRHGAHRRSVAHRPPGLPGSPAGSRSSSTGESGCRRRLASSRPSRRGRS